MRCVKKREVFYLAGYDPRGARHYYYFYKKEASQQSKINNMQIDISTRKRTSKYTQTWEIMALSKDASIPTHTKYHFLEWDDIVRNRWASTMLSIFLDLYFYMKVYMFTGLIVKFGRLSPRQLVPAFYPIVYLFFTLFLSFIIFYFSINFLQYSVPIAVAIIIAFIPSYFMIKVMITIGDKIAVFWLLRIYVFSANYILSDTREIEERIEIFAKKIANTIDSAKENDIDEILIVAHSVGAMIAIPILAKSLSQFNLSEEEFKRVSIMTLGECTALVSFLKEAKEYREQMYILASQKYFFWVDYTSPIDGGCFPLLDYYTHSGVELDEGIKPLFLSPRFHTLFAPQRYNILRKNRYIAHFLYLMSSDEKGLYDYFKITAGDQRLSDSIK